MTPMVAPSQRPTLYRSLVTGEVLSPDDLTECELCQGECSVPHYWRERVDDHGSRTAVEYEPCPCCDGNGVVLRVPAHGTFVSEPVECIQEAS